ncbi:MULTISPECIES: aminotransferase class V-fold PLP-dependent enzyme [unclassified Mesorhizobium]|jgi:L-seryl-tRNA(Ser) seleniumtransferase|uniref:aminotransferase class V-fold PLP-dependent enzyme n=1 Tax=unclassified Mesorhizobium TaxID=325217 RepID=UPI000FE353D9|nr:MULTISPECIES: aminotransferase class V-fold PLP-dependent enzyme [unclassified Mesorhizobium]MDG4894870.1 aminotransferase class V-fold PLP-dependent enzyme [Mesorhizobium sp. WSM4976]RWH74314.1 MAG: aminotransferase class V-fold PLP-dependent enzyme [Mesorhizobium sp.]RWL26084.1 MAG: aminotransferase class V-fold PLP-dependent enzyme [Mesorhizobium sp.]RWL28066.1 MAG: aminotransferase class V-fold PLP-dependent enzyme [Mesorhizobium sp.]RWL37774.1 MAG: aminotransferase class V-fold PLP-dep
MKTYSDAGSNTTIRERLGLRPIINVSGTMTTLGASIIVPEAISAMAEIASQWVEMDDLQRAASAVVARLTGGEAGFITACCASGITMAIAGAMTGTNLLAIERLPDDTEGLKSEVVIQLGHIVNYGAPIDQSIRVAGAKVIPAGTVSVTQDYHVREAINERTAAALYVVAHHTVQYGMLSLEEFCEICHAKGVPVIVDAASEYDLRSFLARGADIVVYSGHKFLSGPTSGIVTGRKDLVRAAYLQNRGVARAMKVGKESIAGTMAALDAWEKRDHAGIRRREEAALNLWKDALEGIPGIGAQIIPDPTNNPLDRLQVFVRPESRFTAAGLASALAAGSPPVIVRNHEVERGHFFLDPCNLHPGEAEVVAEQLRAVLTAKDRPADAMKVARKDSAGSLRWPD